MTTPTSSAPTSAPECTDNKPTCCKCEAYREIIQENATRIAKLIKALEETRQWSTFSLRTVEAAIGKNP